MTIYWILGIAAWVACGVTAYGFTADDKRRQ